jgi:ribosomal protein S18
MILKKYFYRKKEVKMKNTNIESVDKNNLKILKLYITGGKHNVQPHI